MTRARFHALAVCALAAALLSACSDRHHNKIDLGGRNALTEARLSTSAATAIAQGRTEEALERYRALYAKRRHNREVALNYAQLLRKTGDAPAALKVLLPLMTGPGGHPREDIDALLLTELSATHIALGDFTEAEKTLNRVLEDGKAAAFHNDAYNLMGVVMDAQGNHKEAEQLFRLALEEWKGDPTLVMNNLGLSLATAGKFDEALDILRRALVMSPEKGEIARNIQIISDLRSAVVPKAPVDIRKKKS